MPAVVRLLQRLDREYGQDNPGLGRCWEWSGARNHGGYGVLKLPGRRTALAHRVALEAALGRPLAAGMLACHRCDNRRCCRPSHLYEGTDHDNLMDQYARDRRELRARGFQVEEPEEAGTWEPTET